MKIFLWFFFIYIFIAFMFELYIFWAYIDGREQMTDNDVVWYQKRIWTWPICGIIYFLYCIYAFIVEMKLR